MKSREATLRRAVASDTCNKKEKLDYFLKLSRAHAESTKHLMVYSEHFTEGNYTNYFVHLGDTEPRKSKMFVQLMTYK